MIARSAIAPHHTSSTYAISGNVPPQDDVKAAADVINKGKRIAILAGQGALHASDELMQLAELARCADCEATAGQGLRAG